VADLTVSEIMDNDVATASPGDDVESVIRLLREQELPGVPVVDGERRLVGIVTEGDLVLREDDADLTCLTSSSSSAGSSSSSRSTTSRRSCARRLRRRSRT
jgi:CBS-domain-containing membrane protein